MKQLAEPLTLAFVFPNNLSFVSHGTTAPWLAEVHVAVVFHLGERERNGKRDSSGQVLGYVSDGPKNQSAKRRSWALAVSDCSCRR